MCTKDCVCVLCQSRNNPKGSETLKMQGVQHTFVGGLWCAAWLFTIGFLHLSIWRGMLAIKLLHGEDLGHAVL